MTTTPFIDSLSVQNRERVNQKTRGDKRPSFYSSEIDRLNKLNQAQRTVEEFQSPDIQITSDFEAVLILLGYSEKEGVIKFITDAFAADEPNDEVELMFNVTFRRKSTYDQTNTDTFAPALLFNKARAGILTSIESKRAAVVRDKDDETPPYDNVDDIIPELSRFFSSVSTEYLAITKPETIEVHNRVTDQQVLNYYTDEAASRKKELLSWRSIFQTYL